MPEDERRKTPGIGLEPRGEGEVTGWDRCVAMGYGGWDAQPSKTSLPERQAFRRAVREACTIAVDQAITPPRGFPSAESPDGVALQQLLTETVLELSAPYL